MSTDSRKKYLVKNVALFTLANVATKFINFLLVPLYTHVLTTEEYGVVDLLITFSMFLAPVVVANIGESVLRFALDKSEKPEQVMGIGLLCLIGSFVLSLFLIPVFQAIPMLSDYSVYLYFFCASSNCYQVFICYLRGKENTVGFSLCTILNTLLHCVLNIFYLVFLKKGITGYLEAYILSNFITAIVAFFLGDIGKVIKNFSVNVQLTRKMLVYSVVLIPNAFMWWIMDSMDRFVITAFLGAAANGIFAIAYKLPTLLSTIASTFNQAWLYSAVQENESIDRDQYATQIFNTFFAIIILLATGMLMIIKPFLKVYVSSEFYVAWKYAPYLIAGFVFSSLGTFLSSYYNVNFDSKGFLFSAITGALVNVLLNIALVYVLGMTGVALATSISYISVFFYRYFDTKKYIIIKVFSGRNILGIIFLLVMVASVYIPGFIGQIVCCIEFLIVFFFEFKGLQPYIKKFLNK